MNMELQRIELIEQPEPQSAPALVNATTPAHLLSIAVQRGADLAQLERLMDLQERYEKREAEKAYNEAFTAFKAEAVEVLKNKRVTDGPLRGKGYAELHAVVEAATPALSRHGLSASWRITKDERDWIEVTCSLRHTLGHFEAVSMGGPPDTGGAKNAIQARASTVSYLERYTFKAICGLAEKDDDTDGSGGGEDVHPEMKAAKSVQDLSKIMNSLSPADKKRYLSYFNLRQQEFRDAAAK
jgi:hypothetical protein